MIEKKYYYNNLYDSILMLLLLVLIIGLYVIVMVCGMLGIGKIPNKTMHYIVWSIFLVPPIVILFYCIFWDCFGKWTINNGNLILKKIFRKTSIKISEITSVTEKEVNAVSFSNFKTEALVIQSKNKRVNIYLNKKTTSEYIMKMLENENYKAEN